MKRGPLQWVIALDRFANALLFGDSRETLSGRSGYAAFRGKRWARAAVSLIDAIFGEGHCERQARREGLIKDGPDEA